MNSRYFVKYNTQKEGNLFLNMKNNTYVERQQGTDFWVQKFKVDETVAQKKMRKDGLIFFVS
jgi:hypothetical protein